jgi:dTDP-4-dehydrorhamnose reductase
VFSQAQSIQADLTDSDLVRTLFKDCHPDWAIHCAADTAIDDLEADPERASRMNTGMARKVARAAAATSSRLVFVSTDSVFDGRDGPYKESDEPDPQNVYARSKLEGERAVAAEYPGAIIVRTNLFGWSPGNKTSLAEWFYSKLVAGENCTGFSDLYFSPIYAPELAEIFIQMLQLGLSGLYHVPGDECLSKFDFGRRLAELFGFDSALIESAQSDQMDWKAKRPKRTCLEGLKMVQAMGTPLPSLEEGLARFQSDHESGLLERF